MTTRRPVLRRRHKDRWIVRGANQSPTGRVVEALETGVSPDVRELDEAVPGPEGHAIRVGDPDVDSLRNEHTGEEAPGASNPTPDQNLIDATGRVYGLEAEDGGVLRTSSELLDRRDGPRPARKSKERQRP